MRGAKRAAVITNETIAPLYGAALAARLPGGFVVAIPDGEQYKTLDTLRTIYDALLEAEADRGDGHRGVGRRRGGRCGGASRRHLLCGVWPLIQAPTSLLAMVDASIGGKTGVDLPGGKNLVGGVQRPAGGFRGYSDAQDAAGRRIPGGIGGDHQGGVDWRCGVVCEHLAERGPEAVEAIIRRAIAVKIEVVQEDRLEKGRRAVLNLGHTFAHAIEHASGYSLRHGEAVAVGLAAAVRLSVRLGLAEAELVEEIERVVTGLGLPVRYADYDPSDLYEAMRHDKKWQDGRSRFVVIRALGAVEVIEDVAREDVIAVLEEVRA